VSRKRKKKFCPKIPTGASVRFSKPLFAGGTACARGHAVDPRPTAETRCWFEQMACSLSRLVVWVGSQPDCSSAQESFWADVESELVIRGQKYPEVIGMNKLISAYAAAGMGYVDKVHANITGLVSRVHLAERASQDFRRIECGWRIIS
jgi:hypothetical protein